MDEINKDFPLSDEGCMELAKGVINVVQKQRNQLIKIKDIALQFQVLKHHSIGEEMFRIDEILELLKEY